MNGETMVQALNTSKPIAVWWTGGVMFGLMVDWFCDVWWTGGVMYGRMFYWWCDVWSYGGLVV